MNTHACLAASVLAMATTAAFSNSAAAQVTTIVSVSSSNAQANYDCEDCSISADGRYVAFWSYGSNLVPNDSNGLADIFVHDRQLGTTERVNVSSSGAQANGDTYGVPSISADGRYVAFVSASGTGACVRNVDTLVPGRLCR